MKIGYAAIGAIAAGGVLTLAVLIAPPWTAPPIETEQTGFRGTAMVDVADRVQRANLLAENVPPPEPYPFDPEALEPVASEFYENLQVLGDVPAAEFNRMMLAITEWIVPEDYRNDPENGGGCNYCHNPINLASDEVYTKNVARAMIVMTQNINANWSSHVGETGVNCYTCHRGNAVPEYYWFEDPHDAGMGGVVGAQSISQNRAGVAANGYSTLPADPFTAYFLDEPQPIRIADQDMIVEGANASIAMTEHTYALMMHMSTSLGVNCTYCHNSRAFSSWSESTPMRATSWFALQMVPDINASYILPTEQWLPDNRKGPTGQPFSVNCTTCHQGVNKPLNGAPMAPDWPYLQTPPVEWSPLQTASVPLAATLAALGALGDAETTGAGGLMDEEAALHE